jgi:two-component system response regulator HydG
MPSVLIVDDLTAIHEMLEAIIQPIGFTAAFATDGPSAIKQFKAQKFDLVLVDLQMKPMDGITLLKELKKIDPGCVAVMMTAYADASSALDALKLGAFDYLTKPFKVEELISALKRAADFRAHGVPKPKKAMTRTVTVAATAGADPGAFADPENAVDVLVGDSRKIKKVVTQIKRLVGPKTPVLLLGEPGTGKRSVAEFLHRQGNPPDAPLVRYDCGAVDAEELRSGLLGPAGKGGTWTEEARGGTLLLENIQKLPVEAQSGLGSVLRSVGSNFRLVCASTADLERMVDQGKFDEELFFRLATLPVTMPPLRERAEDIPALAKQALLASSHPQLDVRQIEFSPEAVAVMTAYRWPGNLFELRQVVQQSVADATGKLIAAEDLPEQLRDVSDWPSLEDHLAAEEGAYIARVLHACRGDKKAALKILKCEPDRLP